VTAKPGHDSGDGCDCRARGVSVVDFECAAVWNLEDDGYRPLRNPGQGGVSLSLIGFHRVAEPTDYDATKGALRGSFVGDDSPVDDVRYPDRHGTRYARCGSAVDTDQTGTP
jgi:hypothetical protein